jgi:hypothetical protein
MQTFDEWLSTEKDLFITENTKELMFISWNAAIRAYVKPTWQELVKEGKYLSAIKLYRQEKGCLLKEAKEQIDEYISSIKNNHEV